MKAIPPISLGRLIGAVLTLLMVLMFSPVFAAPATCAMTTEALAVLASRYNERPFWVGIMSDGSTILTLTASPDGRTWTALISAANGNSCVSASGESSSMPGPPAPGEEG